MAANFIRSILERFERFRSNSRTIGQIKKNHLRGSPQAEDIDFLEGESTHQRTDARTRFPANYFELTPIVLSVMAFGIALGIRIQQSDWTTVVDALNGKHVDAVSPKRNLTAPVVTQSKPESAMDSALRFPIPTPIQPPQIPLPLGAPLSIGTEFRLPAIKPKLEGALPVPNAVDVTLRTSASTAAVEGSKVPAPDDNNTVEIKAMSKSSKAKPPPTSHASTSLSTSPTDTSKTRAVAILEDRLIVQSVTSSGQVNQKQLAIGEKLEDGQTLLALDPVKGTFTTDSDIRSLWDSEK